MVITKKQTEADFANWKYSDTPDPEIKFKNNKNTNSRKKKGRKEGRKEGNKMSTKEGMNETKNGLGKKDKKE